MKITGGFGTTIDLERGTSRMWVVGGDGVKRWADNGDPVARPDYDEMERALKVIYTWAGVDGALVPKHVIAVAGKALRLIK